MKTSILFLLVCIPFLSISQGNSLTGSWKAVDNNVTASNCINFQENSEILICDVFPEENHERTIEGYYYYENGNDLLVTITWFGDQAKTTIYTYSIEKGQLVLHQTYPEDETIIYERDENLVEVQP